MRTSPFSSVPDLMASLESLAGQPSDDVVAALPHLLQTAELLAAAHADDLELIAAGLVHDIASALGQGCGDHAQQGALLVQPLLGDRVADLVSGHTDAKRYLVTVAPSYVDGLSPNSTRTLGVQGGRMTDRELAVFTKRRNWQALVALRRADDTAKVPECPVQPVMAWRSLVERVATAAS